MKDRNPTENTRTTDWQFDFSSLPRWENHNIIPFIHDAYYPIPQSDALCCIYSISEVRMGWCVGFLAILKSKEHPELILNVWEQIDFLDNFSVSQSGNIIFLQAAVYNKATAKVSCPILIIDIERKRFSYHYKTDNYNPLYKVVEIGDCLFGIQADETQMKDTQLNEFCKQTIDLTCLDWYGFEEIKILSDLIN